MAANRQDENKRIREYYRANPDKKKESNSKWNKKYRNEYQREYRKRMKQK